MEIGPGDFLEALRDDVAPDGSIFAGSVYTCEAAIRPDVCGTCEECGNGSDVILLKEVPLPIGWGWCPCTFRPIYRPKPDAFTDLLKVPDRVGEPA